MIIQIIIAIAFTIVLVVAIYHFVVFTNKSFGKPKRYYYKVDGSRCLEPCTKHPTKKDVKIGSLSCTMCKYLVETNSKDNYIVCSKYPKGKKR